MEKDEKEKLRILAYNLEDVAQDWEDMNTKFTNVMIEVSNTLKDIDEKIRKQARQEAIEECCEKLKKKIQENESDELIIQDYWDLIDDVVKELEGSNKLN